MATLWLSAISTVANVYIIHQIRAGRLRITQQEMPEWN